MGVELAILNDFERCGQQLRYFLRRHHDAILAVNGKDAADQQWIQTKYRYLGAAFGDTIDQGPRSSHADGALLARLIPELESAADEIDLVGATPVAPGALEVVHPLIAQAAQLLFQSVGGQCLPSV